MMSNVYRKEMDAYTTVKMLTIIHKLWMAVNSESGGG